MRTCYNWFNTETEIDLLNTAGPKLNGGEGQDHQQQHMLTGPVDKIATFKPCIGSYLHTAI